MRLVITNQLTEIPSVHNQFTKFAQNDGINDSIINKICVVIDEVLTNIINYGYTQDRQSKITVLCGFEANILVLRFIDDGVQFNPLLVQHPEVVASQTEEREGGLGILLIKHLVDDIQYDRRKNENHLTIRKFVI